MSYKFFNILFNIELSKFCPTLILENINTVSSDILVLPVISILLTIALKEEDKIIRFKINDNKITLVM